MTKLQILIDDKNSRAGLEAEHGFSVYVETPALKFLFDCGHTGAAFRNAEKLGVDLSKIRFAVLSHAHYDHAGGFPALLKIVRLPYIYTGQNFWQEKFSRVGETFEYKGAGFTFQDLARWRIEQRVCCDIVELDDGAWLIGNFIRRYRVEIPAKFVRGEDKIPDNFDDEICLALREGDGAAVVVGCSHVGILNIVATVQKRLDLPVKTVIGGVHTSDTKILAALEDLGVERFALCHCSGDNLRADFVSTGSVLEVI